MGCDGGTIPRRDELVKTKKKAEVKDRDSERLYRWGHCTASQARLCQPIVACELGRLYNKEEIITRLLSKSGLEVMPHITAMKDIRELNLTHNPGYKSSGNKGDELIADQGAEYICPVTSVEMNGKTRFVFIWTCGCVLSDRAMKEIKADTCHKCNTPFLKDDVIILNPNEDELSLLEDLMVARREKVKAKKKKKKQGKRMMEDMSASPSTDIHKKRNKLNDGKGRKSSLQVNDVVCSVLEDSQFKKMTSSSVASDPDVSEVYKSLFHTHNTAQNKQSAHWVTCNPQYF